jgi:hypothetical protein
MHVCQNQWNRKTDGPQYLLSRINKIYIYTHKEVNTEKLNFPIFEVCINVNHIYKELRVVHVTVKALEPSNLNMVS